MSAQASDREWPDHFPDNCPCSNARPVNEDVYHLVRSDRQNFKSSLERDVKEHASADPCIRASLTCYLSFEEMGAFRDGVPRFSKHKIVRAALKPIHGKIKQTFQPPHHSLWLRKEYLARCATLFVAVE